MNPTMSFHCNFLHEPESGRLFLAVKNGGFISCHEVTDQITKQQTSQQSADHFHRAVFFSGITKVIDSLSEDLISK